MKGVVKGVKSLHSCPLINLIYGEGCFPRIKVVYDNLDYLSTFPISILKGAFQEAFHVLRVI